jgi:hypothetical protein
MSHQSAVPQPLRTVVYTIPPLVISNSSFRYDSGDGCDHDNNTTILRINRPLLILHKTPVNGSITNQTIDEKMKVATTVALNQK